MSAAAVRTAGRRRAGRGPARTRPGEADAVAALAPVRAALLAAARADAAATRERAEQEAGRIVADAAARAEELMGRARRRGRDAADAVAEAERARARRAVRGAELRGRREAYDALLDRVAQLLRARCAGPDGPRIADRLTAGARAFLGADAVTGPGGRGGVTGRAPGRVVDGSVTVLAERAVAALGAEVERLWPA